MEWPEGVSHGAKSLAAHYLGQFVYRSRLHQVLLGRTAAVVVFHRVHDGNVDDGLTCNVRRFTEYCEFLARKFRVVSLGSLVQKLEIGEPLRREIAITFDDGYRDNYDHAAPVLKRLGLPATFFIVSGFMGTGFWPWWDARTGVHHSWMNWEEVRSLHRDGFEIGSHTRTHVNLGEVAGEVAWEEIYNSRTDLERQLSAPVTLFAYPFGQREHMTEANRAMVKKAGFRCCCSSFGGINTAGSNPFELQRVPVSSWFRSVYHFGAYLGLSRS
jgi:peptidoglycan/xylan/chitin deacetylase (PgdA/CDA1 family)